MKVLFCAMFLALVAAPAAAQIPLQADFAAKYGFATFDTVAAEPCLSYQAQYQRDGGRTVHVHGEPCGPEGGIVNGDLTRSFTVQTFCLNGRVTRVEGRLYHGQALDFTWDDTGTSTMPDTSSTASATCDWREPGAVHKYTLHYTMHQSATDVHGWIAPLFYVYAHDDLYNHDFVANAAMTFWTDKDPTAPLNQLAEPKVSTLVSGTNPLEGTRWGSNVVERNALHGGWTPPFVVPLTGVFTTTGAGYGYTSDLTRPARLEHRYDTDLHHGHEGMIRETFEVPNPAQGTPVVSMNIDPAVAATSTPPVGVDPGVHKDVLAWFETSNDGREIESSWLVSPFRIAGGTTLPPPPPPPPPPPTWQMFQPQFLRLGDSIKVCDLADGKCWLFGTVQ